MHSRKIVYTNKKKKLNSYIFLRPLKNKFLILSLTIMLHFLLLTPMYLYWLSEGKLKDLDYKIRMAEKMSYIEFDYI